MDFSLSITKKNVEINGKILFFAHKNNGIVLVEGLKTLDFTMMDRDGNGQVGKEGGNRLFIASPFASRAIESREEGDLFPFFL